ncbi:MAG: tRNA uridine-5-carboxymethylaminomethyl(34) synthesis GTPase MnmE [Synergistaceae bacterium]|nr:tRNA uridine-5-carboxymethylaminomethyl(34) synthesis GTPase MnmE [Synergistaceae bacterium]
MDDVIAAVATAWGEAAIAIVRLSGGGAVRLVDKFFRRARGPLSSEPARRLALGRFISGGEVVDEVLAVRFERGSSYTGEESAEVHCHGGIMAAGRVLDLLLSAGARAALPGEFTKRAFLTGRIDLARAEAVSSVIRAASDAALISAGRSLQGGLSARLRELMDALTSLLANIEARLDYPEEVDETESSDAAMELSLIRSRASDLLRRCRVGLVLDGGVTSVIVGRPNVGKSSLLNAMTGRDRAIVTDTPGTTRDTVDASLVHRGLLIRLVDTAGIREASGAAEEIGIERAVTAAKGADICVQVVDSSSPLNEWDARIASLMSAKPAILALNKSDMPSALSDGDAAGLGQFIRAIKISALTGRGIEDLKDAIAHYALGDGVPAEGYAATSRMIEAIGEAISCMDDALSAIKSRGGMDASGSLLSEAASLLASPLGADATEELLDRIFSDFCVGK